jgi:hypothetical protein
MGTRDPRTAGSAAGSVITGSSGAECSIHAIGALRRSTRTFIPLAFGWMYSFRYRQVSESVRDCDPAARGRRRAGRDQSAQA